MKMYVGNMELPEDFDYRTKSNGGRYIVVRFPDMFHEVWLDLSLVDVR